MVIKLDMNLDRHRQKDRKKAMDVLGTTNLWPDCLAHTESWLRKHGIGDFCVCG